MKNKILILSLTFQFCSLFSFGQVKEAIELNIDGLIGVWYPLKSHDKFHLNFEKKVTTEYTYGLNIEFLKNGEFKNRYLAPCGNDTKLLSHNYSGIWSFNEDGWIITTTKPINRQGTVYKIVELKSNRLVLAKIK